MNDVLLGAAADQSTLTDAGLVATILARRHVEFGAEHASEVRRTVESVIERDRRDRATALRPGLQGTRTGFEPATQDVARHGLVLVGEQMMQITSGHLAGFGDAGRR
jgi:hypothetical protein